MSKPTRSSGSGGGRVEAMAVKGVAALFHAARRLGVDRTIKRLVLPAVVDGSSDRKLLGRVREMVGEDVRNVLRRIRRQTGPVIVGPWLSEVGFEILYWIPFLRWATSQYGIDPARFIVVSRGGASSWYGDLAGSYVDVLDLMSPEEFVERNRERWVSAKSQKQKALSDFDDEVIRRVRARSGIDDAPVLHPSLMYRLFKPYWVGRLGSVLVDDYTRYQRLAPPAAERWLDDLPSGYVAVRFYFRPSFPDTEANRRFAAGVIRSLARHEHVVLLNTGLRLDDHEDCQVESDKRVIQIDDRMSPATNLHVQSQVISRARAFVGTYGGLAYLGPFYGVPSLTYYSDDRHFLRPHLDLAQRVFSAMETGFLVLDTAAGSLLAMALPDD